MAIHRQNIHKITIESRKLGTPWIASDTHSFFFFFLFSPLVEISEKKRGSDDVSLKSSRLSERLFYKQKMHPGTKRQFAVTYSSVCVTFTRDAVRPPSLVLPRSIVSAISYLITPVYQISTFFSSYFFFFFISSSP